MKLYGISVNYNFNEQNNVTEYDVILKMKDPNVSFNIMFKLEQNNWRDDIEIFSSIIESSIKQLLGCVDNFSSKRHGEFLKKYQSDEDYLKWIKWFPEHC